jgi:hypothetical protein
MPASNDSSEPTSDAPIDSANPGMCYAWSQNCDTTHVCCAGLWCNPPVGPPGPGLCSFVTSDAAPEAGPTCSTGVCEEADAAISYGDQPNACCYPLLCNVTGSGPFGVCGCGGANAACSDSAQCCSGLSCTQFGRCGL